MNETILEKIQGFSLDAYRPIFPRELNLGEPLEPKAGNLATVITGMRRSGKSYRLFQAMDSLEQCGVESSRMLYFNFEDDRLDPVTPRTGDDVLEAFFYLHPEAPTEGCYLFFDELQEMTGWGKWLRRIIDTTKATIFVTGSSSKMLSAEFSTELRGRTLEFIQYPYSFREYVRFHYSNIDTDAPAFSTTDRVRLQGAFRDYLRRGGFPAVQNQSEPQAVSMLQGYAQRVVARDVLERHDLGSPRGITAFSRKIMRLCGRLLSLRKTENELKSAGFPIGRALLSDALSYFEEAFLIYSVRERSRTVTDKDGGMAKAYPIDPGLARANAPASTIDEGQALEDAVCIELLRSLDVARDAAVSYLKTKEHGYEVDFVAGDALFDSDIQLVQVATNLEGEKTRRREYRALWEAMSEFGLKESVLVIEEGFEENIERGGRVIHCIPAWKWFLRPLDRSDWPPSAS
ncbi:ATP-binding protein [Adlercreutzia shanghongiae]|uniref:ATP-binding protein n=1 Tax=Adlercreutzia shanghongiae TaxID=3111773 RepID=A0ABU6IZU7_9ACTN|nr:ATP-binding protein [Adlercreutzia sp. R22]MEC4295406.1 ATP-binding protein [Adlercreutzia sp. R22]